MKRSLCLTILFCLNALLVPTLAPAQTGGEAAPRVAVFAQEGFPYYGFSAAVTPRQIADDLRAAGLTADLMSASELAQPERFDSGLYAAVVLPYGNMFPQEAFGNLRRFHREGGSLITTGIPFTHPAARLSARDWEATPEWGGAVRLVPDPATKTDVIQVTADADRWTGVSSGRFPVRSGDAVIGAAEARNVTPPRTRKTGDSDGNDAAKKDELFLRYFNAGGAFLRQDAVTLTPPANGFRTFRVASAAPEGAATADISAQMRRAPGRFLFRAFSVQVNGKALILPNADFSRKGDVFVDLGHTDAAALWGQEGIGVGGFAGPGPASAAIAPDDPFHLSGIVRENAKPNPAPQWLNPASLPKGTLLISALGDKFRPLAALIVQQGGPFKGAVDAWTFHGVEGDFEEYETRQIIARATIAALARRGLLDKKRETLAFQRLKERPRPKIYANLTLPTPPRTYTTFQPKMPPPAPHLYVADVRKLSADEKLLLISLQGIVNRKQPRIYLVFEDDDARWLEEMQRQKATETPISVADPFSLLETFRAEFRGAVVCDPKIYVSPCVAVSLAGADDVVVAKTAELAQRFHLPVTQDLRGKFKDDADAYHYLRTEIARRLDPYLTCSLDPAVYDSGALDHIIAARGSAFWITGPKSQNLPGANQAGELEEIRAFFAQTPLGAVVRGFWWHGDGVGLQEDAGVALGSRFGKVTLVSDLIANLSVQSGVPATKLTQKPRPAAPPLDKSKVYLCFTMSDGDNLCTWRGYFRRYFDDPLRGTIPVGWGMGPTILDLAPVWARWYYEKATPNDEFICDVSGVAYIYPPSWATALQDRDGAFRYFYGATQDYMAKMDMKTVRLMNVDAADIARVGPLLPDSAFLMPDYGFPGVSPYANLTYNLPTGQSVFRAVTNGSGPQNLAEQIRSRVAATRPAFVNAFIWNWGSNLSDLKKTLELLGPDYVAVTPSQLNELYRASRAKSGP